jgi:hypothetical protein
MSLEVVVNACASFDDCDEVAALCGSSFPEEVWSQVGGGERRRAAAARSCFTFAVSCLAAALNALQGLSVHQWAQIEADDLRHTPAWWKQIGR